METADAVATLAACAAGAVAQAMEHLPARPARLLVTGGGRLNPGLMEMLEAALGRPVEPVEAVGLDGDVPRGAGLRLSRGPRSARPADLGAGHDGRGRGGRRGAGVARLTRRSGGAAFALGRFAP